MINKLKDIFKKVYGEEVEKAFCSGESEFNRRAYRL